MEQNDRFVSFSAEINPLSRATDTKFDIKDNIGVFAVKSNGNDSKGTLQSSGNYADNVKYTYNGSRFTSSNGIEHRKMEQNIFFMPFILIQLKQVMRLHSMLSRIRGG
ncbi:fimbrillin family protein [uncultured Bacteroides sp.]|uniref:fimbrillin family protein n=1 Tax=uncultured Bacteroides sp. TaxID=162156 RepID=UPI0035A5FF0D